VIEDIEEIQYSWTSLCRSGRDPEEYLDIGMVRDNKLGIMWSETFWQSISFKKKTIWYLLYVMKITFWQFTIFLRYDNNVMTIWNMLIVVSNRSTESQLTWSRTDDNCLKTSDFVPYAIWIKLITLIMAWLFVSVGSRMLKAVTNYGN